MTSLGNGRATGLEAASGGSITKSAGNITVSSSDGTATGLDAQDTHGTYLSYNASTINYGNANTQTQISVYGNEAYGIRAFNNNTPTADDKLTSVEVTNGNITARASGSSAVGAYSVSGNIALKGTTSITAASDSGQSVYSLYATAGGGDDSTITVENASNIQGDIRTATTNSSIAATFQDGGHLKAWTYNTGNLGNLSLTFGEDAVWEMVASNTLTKGTDGKYTGNLTSLSLDGSNVYVGSTQQQHEAGNGFASSQTLLSETDAPAELEMETLSGSGNFYLRTDMEQDISDSVHVTDSLSGTHNLYVNASGAEPVAKQTASYLARAEQTVGADAGAFSLKGGRNVNGQELVDIGLYNYTLETSERNNGREWYLTRVEQLSPTGEAETSLSSLAGHYAMWYGQLTDLRKRLGEVRYSTQTGLWIRGFADKSRLDGFAGTSFTQNLVGGSIGYDWLISKTGQSRWIAGMQIRSAHADQDVNGRWGGYGDLDSTGGGLYATWLHDDGWYMDTVATVDWYNHEIRTTMQNGTRVHDDRSSYGLGLSLEAGRRIDFAFSNEGRDHCFVEPQLQLSYFWVKGGDFTASNGMSIEQDDMDSLTGRAGVVLGKKFSLDDEGTRYIQPYVKAGLNHEFLGDQEAHFNHVRMTSELEGTRGYYGAGVDWQATDTLRFYIQAEREHGEHFEREYNVSAGLKWQF